MNPICHRCKLEIREGERLKARTSAEDDPHVCVACGGLCWCMESHDTDKGCVCSQRDEYMMRAVQAERRIATLEGALGKLAGGFDVPDAAMMSAAQNQGEVKVVFRAMLSWAQGIARAAQPEACDPRVHVTAKRMGKPCPDCADE